MNEELARRVRRFIGNSWHEHPARLELRTRLEEDLGMTGLDASEFLEAFAEAFDIDLTGLEFHKHFGPDCGPILVCPESLREEMKDLGKYPVTVGHLIHVAKTKRWSCPQRIGS